MSHVAISCILEAAETSAVLIYDAGPEHAAAYFFFLDTVLPEYIQT